MKKQITLLFIFQLIYLVGKTQDPIFDWSRGMQSVGEDYAYSVSTNPANGDVYTVGTFAGTIDLNPGPGVFNVTSIGLNDVYIQKMDKNGFFLWAKSFGGTGWEVVNEVQYDPSSNNVYVTGSFQGTVDFDPSSGPTVTALGTSDGYIVRYNSVGTYLSHHTMGGVGSSTSCHSLTVKGTNVYTTGTFTGVVDFNPSGTTTNLTSAGSTDIFVQKLSLAGAFVWAKRMGGIGNDGGYEVIVDGSNNVITTGFFSGTANFNPAGTFNLTSSGNKDIFVSKLSSSGAFSWAKAMGGAGEDIGYGLVLDNSNNIYSCGTFNTYADFDPSGSVVSLTGVGPRDGYVHKLNSSGIFQWVKGILCTGASTWGTYCQDIDIDASNNLYVTGYYSETTDFDPGVSSANLTAVGSADMYALKLDGAGNYSWAKSYGSIAPDYGFSIDVLALNEFYLGGANKEQIGFEPSPKCDIGNKPFYGGQDGFVLKWGPNVDAGWHNTTKNTDFSEIYNDAITDQQGNVYVVGTFTKGTTLKGGENPDITISSGLTSTASTNTFIAKYNQCGNLIWVANSTDFLGNTGNGIVLDENAGMVYITGNFNTSLRFSSAVSYDGLCSTPNTVTASTTGSVRGYVAQFDMNTGCLYFVNPLTLVPSGLLDARSITVNETTGDIYVGGQYLSVSHQTSFIVKYTPTTNLGILNTLNTSVWSIVGDNTLSGIDFVNDLDYDETTNKLYSTGGFSSTMKFIPGVSVLTTAFSDAFVSAYTDLGSSCSQVFLSAGNVTGGGLMVGEGIAVDEANNTVYTTGTYSGNSPNPFGFSTGILPTRSNNSAYMICKNFGGPGGFVNHAYGYGIEEVYGKEVACVSGRAFFVGEFMYNSLVIDNIGNTYFYGDHSSPQNYHVFTASYTSAGTGGYMNVTESATGSDVDYHVVKSITADNNNHCYIVGQYREKMDYGGGTPASNVLVKSGFAGGSNAYIMRMNQNTGEFKIHENEKEDLSNNILNSEGFSIFPNPTNGLTTIAIDNYEANNANYKLVLYNSVGKLVQTLNITGNKTDVDLSNYENGIYLLSFTDGEITSVVRISKTN